MDEEKLVIITALVVVILSVGIAATVAFFIRTIPCMRKSFKRKFHFFGTPETGSLPALLPVRPKFKPGATSVPWARSEAL